MKKKDYKRRCEKISLLRMNLLLISLFLNGLSTGERLTAIISMEVQMGRYAWQFCAKLIHRMSWKNTSPIITYLRQ